MRISDWSSDVCSSDLDERALAVGVDLLLQQIAEIDAFEWVDLDHQSLMRGVARDESREIGDLGIADRNHRRQVELTQRFAGAPDALDGAFGIGERGETGVAAPETDGLAACILDRKGVV